MKLARISLCLVLLAFSERVVLAEHWRQYQHDGGHSGHSDAIIDLAALLPVWSAPGYIEPRILGGTVYAKKRESLSTRAAAFSLTDGQEKWNTLGDGIYFGNMAVTKHFVILEGFNYNFPDNDVFVVLDAATGQERYRLDLPLQFSFADPTLAKDENGRLIAYCTDGGTLVAVQVGRNHGRILWTETGNLANAPPTIVGNSVITISVAGSAFDRATGAKSVFLDGGLPIQSASVSFNSRRGDFYSKLDYHEGVTRVRAFHYINNDTIQLLWTRTTSLNQIGGMVAIGSDDSFMRWAAAKLPSLTRMTVRRSRASLFHSLMAAPRP